MSAAYLNMCIFFLFIIVQWAPTQAFNTKNGWLNASNLELYLGTEFSVLCVLNSDLYPSQKHNNMSMKSDGEILQTDIYNETAIIFRYDKAKADLYKFYDQTYITCVVNVVDKNASKKLEPVGLCSVTMGHKINEGVEETFQCSSDNFDNLKCRFMRMNNSLPLRYSLSYKFTGINETEVRQDCNLIYKMGNNTRPEFTCDIQFNEHRNVLKIITFTAHIQSSLDDFNETFTYNQNYQVQIKTPAPDTWTLKSISNNSILFTWNYNTTDDIIFKFKYEPLIEIISEYDIEWSILDNAKIMKKSNSYSLKIALKYAFAEYTIKFKVRALTNSPKISWSDSKKRRFRSGSIPPTNNPVIKPGFYFFTPNNDLYVYWKELEAFEKNGPDLYYNTSMYVSSDKENIKIPEKMTPSMVKYGKISRKTRYIFEVWAHNRAGKSKNKGFLTIPSETEEVPKAEIGIDSIPETDSSTFKLKLSVVNSSLEIRHFTIFWCKMVIGTQYDCESNFGYKIVDGRLREYDIKINFERVSFAIAVTYKSGITSQMAWSGCARQSKSIGSIQSFNVNEKTYDSAEVEWTLGCEDKKNENKTTFRIIYCEVDSLAIKTCDGFSSNLTFHDASLTKLVINGLKSKTIYNILLQMTIGDQNSKKIRQVFETNERPRDSIMKTILYMFVISTLTSISLYYCVECVMAIRELKTELPEGFPDSKYNRGIWPDNEKLNLELRALTADPIVKDPTIEVGLFVDETPHPVTNVVRTRSAFCNTVPINLPVNSPYTPMILN